MFDSNLSQFVFEDKYKQSQKNSEPYKHEMYKIHIQN